MRQSRSLLFILAFIIVLSASLIVTMVGKDSDTASDNNASNVETETTNNNETPEQEGDASTEPATSDEGTEDEAFARGKEIVNQKCIACHGGNLEGGRGPELQTVGSRLTQEEIEAVLRDGNKTMPPNLLQNEEDVVAAATYLMTLK